MIAFLLKDGERVKISELLKIKVSAIHVKIMSVLMWFCKIFNYLFFAANFLAATETLRKHEPSRFDFTWIGINNVIDFLDLWTKSPF